MNISRRHLLSTTLAFSGSAALGQTLRPQARPAPFIEGEPIDGWRRPLERPADHGPSTAEIIARANLSGRTAVIVTDLSTGEVLDEVDADTALPPASTLKMVTAAYALAHFDAKHRFETRLLSAQAPQDGRVSGDLILQGTGDPLFDTDALITLVEEIRSQGVNAVDGAFRLCNGGLPEFDQIDPGQPVQVGYNPAVAGLNLNFNRVHFQWRRNGNDYDFDLTARSESYDPLARSIRMRADNRDWPVFDYHGGEPELWSVARSALGAGGSRWLPVRKPRQYAGAVFRDAARARGLDLPVPELAEERQDGIALATHRSAEMEEILNGMLRFSTNLTAETSGVAASSAIGDAPESLAASALRMQIWASREGASGHRFVDHSGLGDASRLTPRQLTGLISRPVIADRLMPIAKEVPLDMNDRTAILRVKTGTLNFVSALTGYIPAGDRMLAFTIMSADLPQRQGLSRHEREAPAGGAAWNSKAKALQEALLRRWAFRFS